ncbi:fumarate reductase flavoprotein subunit [Sphingobium sp. AP50]|uniref:FAD-dependent oxidoreductase n=1 Tax=Sphingobium sp. AP50 TaxID=1884369 RepID=UPI0008C7D12A|nr:FAD-dependent oxidoreductase [Sphingobium sp. AP50]SEJ66387.1 fumarate reductase flavoprotein subunit [Sphingobium sp. AP50]
MMVDHLDGGPLDLVVVGGGLAGLTAAVRAAELGLHVLVLEKGEGSHYPCNSRQSGGILHIAFHDPCREPKELMDLIAQVSDGQARPDIARALASEAARFIYWLRDKQVRLMRFDPREMYRWCMAPPRALKGGIDWEGRGPDRTLAQLADRLVALGGELQLGGHATELVMVDGRCVGVRGKVAGVDREWRAHACLIADGGFQADRALFEQHIAPDFDTVFQRGARTGHGDGLKMAVAAGAALSDTHRFYGHLLAAEARSNDALWPFPQLDAVATAGIVVDDGGNRVADEGRTGVYLTNALARVPSDTRLYAIFDQDIWEGPGTFDRVSPNPWIEKGGGTVYRAETLENLSKLISVPADALVRTVAGYNEALAEGKLGELTITRSQKVKPFKIATAPFMAIQLMPGITYTMGGISIDASAQVLGKDSKPIPGLYAAGAATGGLEGGSEAAYIGGLIKAGTFGMLAAERLATLRGKTVEKVSEMASASHSAASSQGLARFPLLRGTLQHGWTIASIAGLFVCGVTLLLGWPSFGIFSLALAAPIGAASTLAILSYVELVRLITELLMPE